MWTFNFHIAYQRNRRMTTTVLDLPLAGGRPGWSGYGQEKPGSDGEWRCLIRALQPRRWFWNGFHPHPGLKLQFELFRLADVWHQIVHTTYCGDCSPAALIIQQVSLPAFRLSKDLSQGSWVRGCEPASPAFGNSFCAPFKTWVCCVE